MRIVENKDATPEIKQIKELNSNPYMFDAGWLWESIELIEKSPAGEYYLTDLVQIAYQQGHDAVSIQVADIEESIGINNRIHLAEAIQVLQRRTNGRWMLEGVTMPDPTQVYIDSQVAIGKDSILYPGTYLRGNTTVGERCMIGPNVIMEDTTIGNDCKIVLSVLEKAVLEDHVDMGPFGHLRKGAHLAEHVHMGNFGEIKNSYLGPGTKMGHFSYVGDAEIGANVNIGAGTVTCNYDGEGKFKTVIGEGVFIGSDTMLVAPVKIGKGSKTGAGAVVTHDVPDNTIVVGVPAKPLDRKDKQPDAGHPMDALLKQAVSLVKKNRYLTVPVLMEELKISLEQATMLMEIIQTSQVDGIVKARQPIQSSSQPEATVAPSKTDTQKNK